MKVLVNDYAFDAQITYSTASQFKLEVKIGSMVTLGGVTSEVSDDLMSTLVYKGISDKWSVYPTLGHYSFWVDKKLVFV